MATVVKVLAAVLAVLVVAAILFPVFTGTHGSPRSACISNLKQCSTGAAIYASDYDDRVPLAARWMDDLVPYTKNEAIFRCPELKVAGFGYGMSKYASGAKVSSDDAALKPLYFETQDLSRNFSTYLPLFPIPSRHKGVAMVSYLDTHAKGIRTEKE
jgi:hypothetical protein